MSEQAAVSPLLGGFTMGAPVNDHFGVCCYPAVKENSDRKYIVKVISVPASQTQLDALLITGAYRDAASAADYFRQLAESLLSEVQLLLRLSRLEGFVPFEGCQLEPMQKNRVGYQLYLLSGFRLSLERYMHRHTVSHLEAVNLGIDLCAALAACRRAGMLYIDLKPSNIFISNKKEYKIGDLGFTPLASIQYSPMPEKYRSSYTPPELLDDLSVLNGTVDTYALGMILYQIFNQGALPQDPTKPLPPPAAADEEMAGILLRACAPDPADRWESPEQMGQALIDYMQRGTINDVPIMEPLSGPKEGKPSQTEQIPASEAPPQENETAQPPREAEAVSQEPEDQTSPPEPEAARPLQEEPPSPDTPEAETPPEAPDEEVPTAEAAGEAEPAPPEQAQPSAPEEADEAEPAPVPEPEPISQAEVDEPDNGADYSHYFADVQDPPLPEAPAPSEDTPDFSSMDIEAVAAEEFSTLTGLDDPEAEPEEDTIGADQLDRELQELNKLLRFSEQPIPKTVKPHPNVEPVVIKPPKKKRSAVGVLFTVFFLCLLLAAGVWGYIYYQTEYLQTVNGITFEENLGSLTVHVDSSAREELLSVVCTDSYGNAFTQNVRGGKAEFTKLSPGTFYTVQVQVSGLHKLSTPISEVYTTEGTTNVAAFNAAVGSQDGSVTLSMIVEGHEPDQWQVFYWAEGEPELAKTFTGHSVTVDGLVIGKSYTFRLELINGGKHSEAGGQNTTQFTPIQVIGVRDLTVVSCIDGVLTVAWNNTTDLQPEYWWVHCIGSGYDESQEVTSTQAVFTGISSGQAYTVEVCAKGMTQTSRVSISANPITLTSLQIDDSSLQELVLSWEYQGNAPEGDWMVMYTLDNSDLPSVVKAIGTSAVIAPKIPGAVYHFTFQAGSDVSVFNGTQVYTCADAPVYSGNNTSGDNISCQLLSTPEDENWTVTSVGNNAFHQNFASGQPISAVLQSSYGNYLNNEDIHILYVYRDASGGASPELIGEETRNWHDLWGRSESRYAELDVPIAPTKAGNYVLDIYFNGMAVASASLSIY